MRVIKGSRYSPVSDLVCSQMQSSGFTKVTKWGLEYKSPFLSAASTWTQLEPRVVDVVSYWVYITTSRQPDFTAHRYRGWWRGSMLCWSSLCLLPEMLLALPLLLSLSPETLVMFTPQESANTINRTVWKEVGLAKMLNICQSASAKELYPWLVPRYIKGME